MKAGLFAVNRDSYLGKSQCPMRVRPHNNLKIIAYGPIMFEVYFSYCRINVVITSVADPHPMLGLFTRKHVPFMWWMYIAAVYRITFDVKKLHNFFSVLQKLSLKNLLNFYFGNYRVMGCCKEMYTLPQVTVACHNQEIDIGTICRAYSSFTSYTRTPVCV